MSGKIYLISDLRANPHRLIAFRRGALVTAIAGALLLGLSACSPRLPAGSGSGAEAAPPSPASGAAAASAKASGAATAVRSTSAGASTASAATGGAAKANASTGGGQAGAQQLGSPANTQSGGAASAYVNFVTGEVTALAPPPVKAGSSSIPVPRRVRVADSVSPGEVITTTKGSAVEVRVGDLFDIGLGEKASLRFDQVGSSSGGGSEGRLALTLRRGALQIKAGPEFVSEASGGSSVPVILEVHTPHLFVSSRGGSLLVTEEVDSTLCAVGRGRAWLLPESVVYPSLAKTVENPAALRLLDSILSQAVSVGRHEKITVPGGRLAKIDETGRAIRAILTTTKGEKSYTAATDARFKTLTAEAARDVASSIGEPAPLSKELRAELDPQSVHHPQMKTLSSIETGPKKPPAARTSQQSASSANSPDVAHTPGYTPPAANAKSTAAAGSTASTGPLRSTRSTAEPASSPPAASAGSSSSVTSLVGDLLSSLFGSPATSSGSSSSSSSGSQSGAESTAGGGIAGPTPPTPPVPPSAPK